MAVNTGVKMEHLLVLACFVNIFCVSTFAEHVPVYIMGLKSSSNYPSVSAFGSLSHKEFRAKYLDQLASEHKSLVAFVQDQLSSEDLSRHTKGLSNKDKATPHLESQLRKNPSLVLPSVENPIEGLRSMKNAMKVREIKADSKEKFNHDSLKPELVIYHLPASLKDDNPKMALRINDEFMKSVMKDLKSSDKDFVALYTGLQPSYDSKSEMELHYRIARQLNEAYEIEVPDFEGNLLNMTNLLMYGNNISLQINSVSHNMSNHKANFTWPPRFQINKASNTSVELTLVFAKNDEIVTNLEISMNITNATSSGFWEIRNVMFNASLTDREALNKFLPLKLKSPYELGASKGFSFSCDKTLLKGSQKNETEKLDLSVKLVINRFQVEWYPRNGYFSESFDCFTFFTIPIWMGLLTVLLFTAILGFGIFMLFEVKTMDRFDDPKGKSISVPLVD